MKTVELIDALNDLTGEDVKKMTGAELKAFRILTDHWSKMADAEAQRRKESQAAFVA